MAQIFSRSADTWLRLGLLMLFVGFEVPNHSTLPKNRHGRFRNSDLFRWLFNEVLRRCMDAGLVKGEGFAVDASIIKADASRQRGVRVMNRSTGAIRP